MAGCVRLHMLDEVDSTNAYARRLATEGAPEGTAVLARRQTAGRGRLARRFASPEGGMYLSVILRPALAASDLACLTPMAALAAAEAVEEETAAAGGEISVGIKWVNDLFVNGRKLAGILCESALSPSGESDFAIVGIGINLRADRLPPELAGIATAIEDEAGVCLNTTSLARRVTQKLLARAAGGDWLSEYRRRMILFGQTVTVSRGEERFLARPIGLGERGELIVLRAEGGEREVLSAGEVTLHRENGDRNAE